jgi:hypothetical protein
LLALGTSAKEKLKCRERGLQKANPFAIRIHNTFLIGLEHNRPYRHYETRRGRQGVTKEQAEMLKC